MLKHSIAVLSLSILSSAAMAASSMHAVGASGGMHVPRMLATPAIEQAPALQVSQAVDKSQYRCARGSVALCELIVKK